MLVKFSFFLGGGGGQETLKNYDKQNIWCSMLFKIKQRSDKNLQISKRERALRYST